MRGREPRVLEQLRSLEPFLGLLLHQGLDQLLGILAGGWVAPEGMFYQRTINEQQLVSNMYQVCIK